MTSRREQLGRNALKVVRENLGAIERTVDMIVEHLDSGELYVAPPERACCVRAIGRRTRHASAGSLAAESAGLRRGRCP